MRYNNIMSGNTKYELNPFTYVVDTCARAPFIPGQTIYFPFKGLFNTCEFMVRRHKSSSPLGN